LDNFLSIGNTNRSLLGVPALDLHGVAEVPSVASASALTIPTFEGNFKVISVTGTTTINSCVATNHTGKTIVLVFTASVQVNDANQLKIAGVFNATADSTLTLSSNGTNWYEVSRSIN
jgi:hypothetical protein